MAPIDFAYHKLLSNLIVISKFISTNLEVNGLTIRDEKKYNHHELDRLSNHLNDYIDKKVIEFNVKLEYEIFRKTRKGDVEKISKKPHHCPSGVTLENIYFEENGLKKNKIIVGIFMCIFLFDEDIHTAKKKEIVEYILFEKKTIFITDLLAKISSDWKRIQEEYVQVELTKLSNRRNDLVNYAQSNNISLSTDNVAQTSKIFKDFAGEYLSIRSASSGRWIHFYKFIISDEGVITKERLGRTDDKSDYYAVKTVGNIIDIDITPKRKRFLAKLNNLPTPENNSGSSSYYFFEKFDGEEDYRGFQIGDIPGVNMGVAVKRARLRKANSGKTRNLYELTPFDLLVNVNAFKELPLNKEDFFLPLRHAGKYDNIMTFHDAGRKNAINDELQLPHPVLGDVFLYAAAYIIGDVNHTVPDINSYKNAAELMLLSAEHAMSQDFERINLTDGEKDNMDSSITNMLISVDKKDAERLRIYSVIIDYFTKNKYKLGKSDLQERYEDAIKIHFEGYGKDNINNANILASLKEAIKQT